MSGILDDRRCEASSPFAGVDAVDATQYPTRNVRDMEWKHRSWMDTSLDVTADERIRTNSADSAATAS
jgi:hypothetical protein